MKAKAYIKIPAIIRRSYEHFLKRNNGEFWSEKLREIYRNVYGIDAGIGTYGCFDVNKFPKNTHIGNYCSIADKVKFLPRNHPLTYMSTHPMFFNEALGYIDESPFPFAGLNIGHDVWIGYGAIICPKCNTIGNGAVIAAGAVVTEDVKPYSIVGGSPAKIIRMRFDDETVNKLESSQWYKLKPEELSMCIDSISSVDDWCYEIKRLYENHS